MIIATANGKKIIGKVLQTIYASDGTPVILN
jgi:hypothetical protein